MTDQPVKDWRTDPRFAEAAKKDQGEQQQQRKLDLPSDWMQRQGEPDYWRNVLGDQPEYQWYYGGQDQTTAPGYEPRANDPMRQMYARQYDLNPKDYEPSFWEDPYRVARYKHYADSLQPGEQLPSWLDKTSLDLAYDRMAAYNKDAPYYAWRYLPSDDPYRELLKSMAEPPPEGRLPGDQVVQVEQLPLPEEPTLKPGGKVDLGGLTEDEFAGLPGWQQSMIKIFGQPWIQGAVIGLQGGLPGALVGAGIGQGAARAASEGGALGEAATKIMGALDVFAEGFERALGTSIIAAGAALTGKYSFGDIITHLDDVWNAAHLTYELTPVSISGWDTSALQSITSTKYEQLGQEEIGLDALLRAYQRIRDGEKPETVWQDMSSRVGFQGQMRELVGHVIADPLNFVDLMGKGALFGAGKLTKNVDLAQAAMKSEGGLIKGLELYRTLERVGKTETELSRLGTFHKWLLGVDEAGKDLLLAGKTLPDSLRAMETASKIGGVMVTSPVMGLIGYGIGGPTGAVVGALGGGYLGWKSGLGYLSGLTPSAKASELTNVGAINLQNILNVVDDDVPTMLHTVRSLANTPADLARELSMVSISSPEGAVLPMALRDFDVDAFHNLSGWDNTTPIRTILQNISDATGKPIFEVLHDLGREGADASSLLRQFVDTARQSTDDAAREIVRAYDAGELTAAVLQDIGKVFTRDKLPYNEQMYKAQLYSALTEHTAKWTAKYFDVKPDPTWVRLSNTIKSAQSIVLLGGNPIYLANNAINNLVTMAYTGVFGLRRMEDIGKFWDDVGIIPPRLRAGFGPAAIGEDIPLEIAFGKDVLTPGQQIRAGETAARLELRKAATAPGKLTDIDRWLRGVSDKFGVFSNLSAKVEQWSSAQALTAGYKQMWARLWGRGRGYDPMPPALERALGGIDPNLPGLIYGVIDGAKNRADIESKLWSGVVRNSVDSFVPEVARNHGMDEGALREILQQTGAYDFLRNALGDNPTPQQVGDAFRQLREQVNQRINDNARDGLVEAAESARVQVANEGWQAALDIYDRMELSRATRWLQNFADWERVFTETETMTPGARGVIIRQQANIEQAEWQRQWAHEKASYLGVAEALGVDNPESRSFIELYGRVSDVWDQYHTQRWQKLRDFFNTVFDTPERRSAVWNDLQDELDRMYVAAAGQENNLQTQMDGSFVRMFETQFGEGTGQGAAEWRLGVRNIRDQMVQEMRAHRDTVRNMPREEKLPAWTQFLDETYKPLIVQRFRENVEGIRRLFGGEEPAAPEAPRPPEMPGGGIVPEAPRPVEPEATVTPPPAPIEPIPPVEPAPVPSAPRTPAAPRAATPQVDTWMREAYQVLDQANRKVRLEEARQVAQRYGVPTADETGRLIPGSDRHIQNVINRYGSPEVQGKDLRDIDAADIEAAFQARAAEQAVQAAAEGQPVQIASVFQPVARGANIDPESQRQIAEVLQREYNAAHLGDWRRGLTEGAGEGDIPVPEQRPFPIKVTRETFREQLRQSWEGATDEQVDAFMTILDAEANYWSKQTGKSVSDYYGENFAGAVKGGVGELEQAAPIWYSKLERVIEGIQGKDLTVERLRSMLKKGQVKPDELRWTGLEDWLKERAGQKISKDEVLDFVRGNRVTVRENLLIGSPTLGEARYNKYTLPGAINYRELLFELPTEKTYREWLARYKIFDTEVARESFGGAWFEGSYQSPHWSDENVLAHVRFDDRVDDQGRRILFVEEVQSDWHQKGKELGYKITPDTLPEGWTLKKNGDQYSLYHDGREIRTSASPQDAVDYLNESGRIGDTGISPAPFAETWQQLVMKRMLRWASENGYDGIAWTTGKQQSDRYAKALQENYPNGLIWTGTDLYSARADGRNIGIHLQFVDTEAGLEKIVGKDIAKKLVSAPSDEWGIRYVPASEFTVSLKGMQEFYDRNLVNWLDKYTRQWGGKVVGETRIATGLAASGAADMIGDNWQFQRATETVHFLEITPAMRESVMQGQPLFQGAKAAVSFSADGRAVLRALNGADVSSLVHEAGHVFRRHLSTDDVKIAEDWAGVADGVWLKEHEEKFAKGFEEYLREGKAPTEGLRAVFEKFKNWLTEIYARLRGHPLVELNDDMRTLFDKMLGESPDGQQFTESNKPWFETDTGPARLVDDQRYQTGDGEIKTLFQEGEPVPAVNAPLGTAEHGNNIPPINQASEEFWRETVWPLLSDLRDRLSSPRAQEAADLGGVTLTPEMRREMRGYLGRVSGQMADAKLASVRWAENRRDMALLNYSRRYGWDNFLGAIFPYQFWYTRSMMNWASRALDKPGLLANYARIRSLQNMVRTPGYPSRLAGKTGIPMPYLPEWAGDEVYVDPLRQLFPIHQLLQPFETVMKQNSQVDKRAEYAIQEWLGNGEITNTQAMQALQARSGPLWEKALAQSKNELDADYSNPFDFMSLLTGPSLPIQWATQLMRGKPENISQLPVTRFIQSVSSIAGLNNGKGVNIEGPLRRALGWPERGQYQDYFVDRMLANMAADGSISPADATKAMVERSGPAFELAQQRVAKVDTARYFAGSFSADFFPEGEKTQRENYEMFKQAIEARDAGDPTALTKFFDDHPEFESRLMQGDDPKDQLRQYLISEVWDRYQKLPDLERRTLTDQFGDVFQNAFLNKETRSYDAIDTATLAWWTKTMGGYLPKGTEVPQVPVSAPAKTEVEAYQKYVNEKNKKFPNIGKIQDAYYKTEEAKRQAFLQRYPQLSDYWNWRDVFMAENPSIIPNTIGEDNALRGASPQIQQAVYEYRSQRVQMFPNIFDTQNEYYDLTGNARKNYLKQHPELSEYWNWQRSFLGRNPEAIPYIKSTEQIASAMLGEDYTDYQVDPAQFDPVLVRQLMGYFYGNQPLSSGAKQMIRRIWEQNGKPMGSLDAYINKVLKWNFSQ